MISIATLHGYILGLAVVSSWAVVCFWALALRLLGYQDTPTFWRVVSLAQILLGVQLLVGLVLVGWWLFGNGPAPGARAGGGWFNATFHLLYGIGFPFVVLLVGHDQARKGRHDPHTVFSIVGLVIFGLTARAFAVGAGIGA
jgi:hypothetical protein